MHCQKYEHDLQSEFSAGFRFFPWGEGGGGQMCILLPHAIPSTLQIGLIQFPARVKFEYIFWENKMVFITYTVC